MKVYVHAPRENWIVDRFVHEWNRDNADISTLDPQQADVIWLLADWCWRQLPYALLRSKKVLTTVHHVVPQKFDVIDFQALDSVTDAYHVPNTYTQSFFKPPGYHDRRGPVMLTKKPMHVIPYWANQHIWRRTEERGLLRRKYKLPEDRYLIGSFQRDTEGAGIPEGKFMPKLEKGPDLLCDYVEHHITAFKNLQPHVVLAGWRRQYVIARLEALRVEYSYFEMPDQPTVNELYQTLDIYPVTARYEGGPQSLIECALIGIPVVSRRVGMANAVLPISAVNDDLMLATPCIPSAVNLTLPEGYYPYRELMQTLCGPPRVLQ